MKRLSRILYSLSAMHLTHVAEQHDGRITKNVRGARGKAPQILGLSTRSVIVRGRFRVGVVRLHESPGARSPVVQNAKAVGRRTKRGVRSRVSSSRRRYRLDLFPAGATFGFHLRLRTLVFMSFELASRRANGMVVCVDVVLFTLANDENLQSTIHRPVHNISLMRIDAYIYRRL